MSWSSFMNIAANVSGKMSIFLNPLIIQILTIHMNIHWFYLPAIRWIPNEAEYSYLISFKSYKNRIWLNYLFSQQNWFVNYLSPYSTVCVQRTTIAKGMLLILILLSGQKFSFKQSNQKNKMMYNWKALSIPNSLSLSQ